MILSSIWCEYRNRFWSFEFKFKHNLQFYKFYIWLVIFLIYLILKSKMVDKILFSIVLGGHGNFTID